MRDFEQQFSQFIQLQHASDAAHDLQHVLRVVKSAKQLCRDEAAIADVVVPAAWLHDCVSLAKDHPQRDQASRLAADKAIEFLAQISYPPRHFSAIHHAIVAHSFSAKVTPHTIEAQIVQDADRLDALGAIGIVRCIQVGNSLQRTLYSLDDPFCQQRLPDDTQFTLDHCYQKLLGLSDTMCTAAGRLEAHKRSEVMRAFLQQLAREIEPQL
ncbi:HD domain-containing protein [Shewanella algidipiscicola]|uniref:HD domain-containing protein n=1 Tax=Shewanella algidipiscicola TaxID=614070 RepID=UPI000D78C8FD|nr:HD domain-containing protein [Shewanella algidipiscicola]